MGKIIGCLAWAALAADSEPARVASDAKDSAPQAEVGQAIPGGKPVDGLQLALGAEKAGLKVTFANVGDKPIKLDAWDLEQSTDCKLSIQVVGADGKSVFLASDRMLRMAPPPKPEEYPELKPGERYVYPGRVAIPGTLGNVHLNLAAGEYRITLVYTATDRGRTKDFQKGAWTGKLVSNELDVEIPLKDPSGAPDAGGPVVAGLRLKLTTDKPDYAADEAIAFTLTFKNTSDKPMTLNTHMLNYWRLKWAFTGIVRQWTLVTDLAVAAPTAASFPKIGPGEARVFTFRTEGTPPGLKHAPPITTTTFEGGGRFTAQVTYTNRDQSGYTGPVENLWTGEIQSNRAVFTVQKGN